MNPMVCGVCGLAKCRCDTMSGNVISWAGTVTMMIPVPSEEELLLLNRLQPEVQRRNNWLQDKITALQAENERLRDELRQGSVDYTRAEVERLREELRLANKWLREALQDIDALKQAAGNDSLGRETERLREEIASLRTDAERYRWLRENKFKHNGHCFALKGPILWETTLDAAIDAAMKEAALQGETAVWAARHDPRG